MSVEFWVLVEEMMTKHLIKKEVHSDGGGLVIYNYTTKCQMENEWNAATMQCRGLIVDEKSKTIKWRGFPKFFNHDQRPHETAAAIKSGQPFQVFDKADGSLGILYRSSVANQLCIATRGSFTSPQSQAATKMLHELYADDLPKLDTSTCSYLFEIIYPENRVVVDYGDARKLVLLAVLDTATGKRLTMPTNLTKIPLVIERTAEFKTFDDVLQKQEPNKEGFVVIFADGLMVKVKFNEYKTLHQLMSGINTISIWKTAMHGKRLADVLTHNVPDEVFGWAKDVENKLHESFDTRKTKLTAIVKECLTQEYAGKPKKQVADFVRASGVNAMEQRIVFNRWNNKKQDEKLFDAAIWDSIKPTMNKPPRGSTIIQQLSDAD
jgi:RNA ligase